MKNKYKMKKTGVFNVLSALVIVLLISSFISGVLVSAQEDVPGLGAGEAPLVSEAEQIANESRWQYLSKEWKSILLKNKVVAAIDNFLSKPAVSVVFKVLVGMPYSLSFKFFVVVILWLWLLFIFKKFAGLITKSGWISSLIGLGFAVIFAQVGILGKISKWLLDLLFTKKPWYWHLIIAALIIIIMMFIYYCASAVKKAAEESKKKAKEKETEQKQKEIKAYTEEAIEEPVRIPRVS